MISYSYDHIHLRSLEPMETARYFEQMFGAKILESVQSDGQSRIDLDINGLIIFIAKPKRRSRPARLSRTWDWTTSGCGWTTSRPPSPTSRPRAPCSPSSRTNSGLA